MLTKPYFFVNIN